MDNQANQESPILNKISALENRQQRLMEQAQTLRDRLSPIIGQSGGEKEPIPRSESIEQDTRSSLGMRLDDIESGLDELSQLLSQTQKDLRI